MSEVSPRTPASAGECAGLRDARLRAHGHATHRAACCVRPSASPAAVSFITSLLSFSQLSLLSTCHTCCLVWVESLCPFLPHHTTLLSTPIHPSFLYHRHYTHTIIFLHVPCVLRVTCCTCTLSLIFPSYLRSSPSPLHYS